MQIDLAPILNQVISGAAIILTPIISGMAVIALKKVADYFHIKVEAHDQQTLLTAITNGVALIEQQAKAAADANGTITTNSEKIAMVAAYVAPKVSDAIKRLKVNDEQKLGEIIAAQMAKPKPDATVTVNNTQPSAP